MPRLLMEPIGTPLNELLAPGDRDRNAARMAALDAALAEKLAAVRAGWGPKYVERVHQKGKLTTWERLELLVDPGTAIFPIGSLVNWGRQFAGSRRQAPGAGLVTALITAEGRRVVVIANDNTVASGSWWPRSPEKIQRAQELARRLRLPVVYLVDCSGLFLPEQSRSFSGARGAGHIFKMNALLSAEGVPQIAGVFGDSIAGGGYMPIISDRVYMTESAYMVIAGAALIKGAKSQKLTSLDIGGPEVHVNRSGCADERVPDDPTAIARIREELARLPGSGADFYRHGVAPQAPRFPAADLSAILPPDHRQVYDMREVLARLVDASLFHEFLPDQGREVIVGAARIGGLWVGLAANNVRPTEHPERPGTMRAGGILYRDGIAKLAAFCRACDDDGLPLIWLQDIAGFDIGAEAEARGLLGYGSSLIYANSTNRAPMITVLLRRASGAGYYAMSGHPYDPVLQLSTPITRLAVMEGRTLAIAAYNSKLDDDFQIASSDPEERAAIAAGMAETAARIEADMDPVDSASRMDTDEVVPVSALRSWLELAVECCYQATGYRRVKNPRIWSLHDLEALAPRSPGDRSAEALVLRGGEALGSPTVGSWLPSVSPGAVLRPGLGLGLLRRAGRWLSIVAPRGAAGQVLEIAPPWTEVEAATELVSLGALAEAALAEAAGGEGEAEGLLALRASMAGTLYRRPAPEQPEFAPAGSRVEARETVALVEVMKTFTPLAAPAGGTLERWLVAQGEAVEAGAVVAWIRPD